MRRGDPLRQAGRRRGLARALADGRGASARRLRARPICPTAPGGRRRSRCWPACRSARASRTVAAAITYTRACRDRATGHEVERLLALAGRRTPAGAAGLAGAHRRGRGRGRRAGSRSAGSRPASWRSRRARSGAPSGGRTTPSSRRARRPAGASSAAGTMRRWPLTWSPRRRAGRERARASSSLRASAALIGGRAVLVTNDSAPLHLATAVGTPVVASSGRPCRRRASARAAPRESRAGARRLACRPCSAHGPRSARWAITAACGAPVETVAGGDGQAAGAEERRAIRPRH